MKRESLKILHWPTSYPDPSRGKPYGNIFIEEHIKSVAPFCENRVVVITNDLPRNGKFHEFADSLENEILVTRIYFSNKINKAIFKIYSRIVIAIFFLRLILAERFYPKILHVHNVGIMNIASNFAFILGIPIILTEHFSVYLGSRGSNDSFFRKAKKRFDSAKHIILPSRALLKGIEFHTNAKIRNKTSIIFNCADNKIFTHKDIKKKDIIYIGRNHKVKNLPFLLEAFSYVKKEIPDISLNMVCSKNGYYNIDTLIKKFGVEGGVTLIPPMPKEKLAALMQRSKLLVLSSTIENSPCVIGEAHSCGLPVVATDVGGVKELIIAGELVQLDSTEDFGNKIIKVLKTSYSNKSIAEKASSMFSHDAIGVKHFEVYSKVLADKK